MAQITQLGCQKGLTCANARIVSLAQAVRSRRSSQASIDQLPRLSISRTASNMPQDICWLMPASLKSA